MVVYPLSAVEEKAIRWVTRIIPVVAVSVILCLGAISFAAARV